MVINLLSMGNTNRQESSENLKNLEDMCKHCAPITPIRCISLCRFYKLKNELRNLRNIMNNPNYTVDFFNVLKNQTRLHIFQTIVNGKYTLAKIQQELKNNGTPYSLGAISDDYIQPLITIGLVTESLGKYQATLFGTCIHDILYVSDAFLHKLPPQSECHEEILLQLLLSGPKNRQEIQQTITPTVVSRALKRLAATNLIHLPADRNYIYFHKSKRDSTLETLTDAEMKIYQTITNDGIGIDKLSKLAKISQRRTYNHIRHLKGKKLVFTRNIPPTYSLTPNGQKLAITLQNMLQKIAETWGFTESVIQPVKRIYTTTPSSNRGSHVGRC